MKKIASLLLVLVLIVALFAGCSGGNTPKTSASPSAAASASASAAASAPASASASAAASAPASASAAATPSAKPSFGPFKIAVAFGSITPTETAMEAYLQKYIGPAFNATFVFSEALSSTDAAITFIENANASGATGLMNFYSDAQEQIMLKANDLKMFAVTNSNTVPASCQSLPYILGDMGSSVQAVADSFATITKNLTSDGKKHNVVIVSGGAGMGNNQHRETTVAILQTLQSIYNLKYDKEIVKYATVTAQTQVNTGTDMKIAIYPGYPSGPTYVQGISALLQSGDYDTVFCTFAGYTQFTAAIDQVEKAFKMDIRLASIAALGSDAQTAFTTKDSTGDTVLNAAIVKPSNLLSAGMFAELYNGLTGARDLFKAADGKAQVVSFPMWSCSDAAGYAKLANLDKDEKTYAFTNDDLMKMIKGYTPGLTYEQFTKAMAATSPEDITAKRGIK